MISFVEFLKEQLSEEEIDQLVEELVWEDIADLFEELDESISTSSRMKKAQRFRARKTQVGQARNLKTHRAAPNAVLQKRAKLAARRMIQKKMLKGRTKQQLSAQEKDRIEKAISAIMANQKALATKFLPKVRALEKARLDKTK